MSTYFEKFPRVFYLFGDEKEPVLFQKLTKYSDLIDQFREQIGTYIEYEIRDGDRPDTVSNNLYGRPDYDWTIYLMNPRLRETGWPMTVNDVYNRAVADFYPNYVAKIDIDSAGTLAEYADIYPPGTAVTLGTKNGIVVSKDLGVGEITISSDSTPITETILAYKTPTSNPRTVLTSLTNTVYEYEGTHHYENDSDEWIDFFFSTEATKVPKTNLEYLIDQNTLNRTIRVIKGEYIEEFVGKIKYELSVS